MDIENTSSRRYQFCRIQYTNFEFSGSRLINFQINLDSLEHDIINSIKQLKKNQRKYQIRFYIQNIETIKKQLAIKLFQKGNKKIINFADALYTYDLYKILEKNLIK